jgi:hypothetical protein
LIAAFLLPSEPGFEAFDCPALIFMDFDSPAAGLTNPAPFTNQGGVTEQTGFD